MTERAGAPTTSWAATAAAAAAVAIAMAVGISEGLYEPTSLALVTAAAGLVAFSLFAAIRGQGGASSAGRWPSVVLGLGVLLGLGFDAAFLPGILVDPAKLGAFRPVLGAIALLCATLLWPRPPTIVERLRFPALVVLWLVLAAIVVRSSPAPGIDVWRFQQGGAITLADGSNPYTAGYLNPYGPGTQVLAPEVLSPDGRYILANPYPPLTLLVGIPAEALGGDIRWAHLLATAGAALLVYLLGRRARAAELAGTFLLVQPRTLMVMELSWTEPIVLVTVAALAALAARSAVRNPLPPAPARPMALGETVAIGLAAGLAVSSKQYAILLVLPFWPTLPASARGRVAAVAAGLVALVHLPFLLWNAGALWRSLVRFHLVQPFRPDALSWPAAVVAWGGPELPTWPSFAVAGVVLALGAFRVRSIAAALTAGALAWLLFVVANKQAFANYYWLAVGLLCAAVAASTRDRSAP